VKGLEGEDDSLPGSGVRTTPADGIPVAVPGAGALSGVAASLARGQVHADARCPYQRLSGEDDHFRSVSDLSSGARSGVYFEEGIVPCAPLVDIRGRQLVGNAYLLNFWRHGSLKLTTRHNNIVAGEVWFVIKDFAHFLLITSLALRKQFEDVDANRQHADPPSFTAAEKAARSYDRSKLQVFNADSAADAAQQTPPAAAGATSSEAPEKAASSPETQQQQSDDGNADEEKDWEALLSDKEEGGESDADDWEDLLDSDSEDESDLLAAGATDMPPAAASAESSSSSAPSASASAASATGGGAVPAIFTSEADRVPPPSFAESHRQTETMVKLFEKLATLFNKKLGAQNA
jgi:hypothetical protein